jgi:K+-transporting ATPase A subunit
LTPILRPVESALYMAAGVDEKREQGWLAYTIGMLLFHVGGFLILYGLMRFQALLPFNPAEQSAVAPDLSFNTSVSFITNTNWQNYGGRKYGFLSRADARPDASELPVGGDRHCASSRAYSWFCASFGPDHR